MTLAPPLPAGDRVYGRYRYLEETEQLRPRFVVDCEPHVMIRLKRNFPRMLQSKRKEVILAATREVAADLAWFMARFPLQPFDDTSAHVLEAMATEHHQRQEQVLRVLDGYQPPLDLREPAVEIRGYQQTAVNLARTTGQLVLGDDVGVGKTHPACALLCDPAFLPALIVVPTLLPKQWERRLGEIVPWLDVHIAKKTTPVDTDADVIILNYAKLAGWSYHLYGRLGAVIFDEVQEIRRDGTDKYAAAHRVCYGTNLRMGLTATPVYNYGVEMFNILNVVAPDILGSRDEFLREWGGGGQTGSVADPAALGKYLREQGVFLRRTRDDPEVDRELPEVQRPVVELEIDFSAIEKADPSGELERLAKVMLDPQSSGKDIWHASGDIDWRMRLATGVAKAGQVAEFVKMLLQSGPVVLFGWHRDVYAAWDKALAKHHPVFITGSESTPQKLEATRRFMEGETDLLIVSLRSGAGLDGLQERAHVCVFGELDWSPGVHHQCIGRLHRDGQDQPVVAYFMVATEGADPAMSDVLELKRQQSEPIVDPDRPLTNAKVDFGDRLRAMAKDYLSKLDPNRKPAGPDALFSDGEGWAPEELEVDG